MEELDLKELIQIFWEKRIQILLITAIFIVLGIIYTVGFVKPKYQSKTRRTKKYFYKSFCKFRLYKN